MPGPVFSILGLSCRSSAHLAQGHPLPPQPQPHPHLLQYDVNVACYELGNLLPFCCLHRVVTILVISKILQR